jgi:PAS domain S-box-containing protein
MTPLRYVKLRMAVGIKISLLVSFLVIIFLVAFASVPTIILEVKFNSQQQAIIDNIINEYSIIGTTAQLSATYSQLLSDINNAGLLSQYQANLIELDKTFITLNKATRVGNDLVVYKRVQNTIGLLKEYFARGLVNAQQKDFSHSAEILEQVNLSESSINDDISSLVLMDLSLAKGQQVKNQMQNNFLEMGALMAALIVLIITLVLADAFSKRISNPLVSLSALANSVPVMDSKFSVPEKLLKKRDEIGILANSFNTMVFSLRSSIEKLQEYNLEIENSRNQLRSEKDKLQQYLDVAGVIVLIFDYNNNVFLINKKGQEIFGITPAEITGKDWVGLFVTKNDRIKTRSLLNSIQGHIATVDTLENILIAKDQSAKNVVWHFSALKEESGTAPMILATGVDVTELDAAKATISQLKEVDRLKNEVLNIATHELKTPLISIVGLSEVMEMKPDTLSPDYKNYVSIIHQEGLKLTNLIKSMLSVSRNELGKITAVKEAFNLADLLLSLKTSLQMLVKRTDSSVDFKIDSREVDLESDKAKISQVVYNFVDNAVKYGPKNQTISITLTKPDPQTVKVAVTGAGQGISEEDQKRLFLKFSQLEPSLSRSQDGMGLGLYICKQNIENLGGQIGVVSQPNQGATFYFTLPVNSAPGAPAAKSAPATSTPKITTAAVSGKKPVVAKSADVAKPVAAAKRVSAKK